MTPRLLRSLTVLLAACSSLGACSSPGFVAVNPATGQSVAFVPGDLRAGQSFTGNYYSPQAGDLWLQQTGTRVHGGYRQRVCDCTLEGRVWGSVAGNRAELEFSESFTDCTPARTFHGTGFFFYRAAPPPGSPPSLFGYRAYRERFSVPRGVPQLGEARGGGVWTAAAVDPAAPLAPEEEGHCP